MNMLLMLVIPSLGLKKLPRDIPNVSESMLESLDEDGIVRIGTRVKAGRYFGG